MIKFVIKRLLLMIPVILGVLIIVFFLSRAMPGDPVVNFLSSSYTEEEYLAQEAKMGLDKPLIVQLWNYVVGVATRFDLGYSYSTGQPVMKELGSRIWVTIELGLMSCLLTVIVGIPFGIISATKQYSVMDYSVTSASILFAAMPGFWLALMAIILFTQVLGWLPASGLYSWKHYIMPVVCNSLMATAVTARMTRSSMLEVVRQDYISTARAKGLREFLVIKRHALKNAIIPIITIIGIQCGVIIGGSVVIESIFSIVGMGTLLVTSINGRDYPTVMGITVVVSLFICVVNLLVDIAYSIADPRIKAQFMSGAPRRKVRRLIMKGGHLQ